MTEWKTYRYTEIADLIGGGTPKTSEPLYWDGDIPWLSVKDFVGDSKYVFSTEKHITKLGLENSSTKLLQKDDIIISARGTVGEMAMIPFPMSFNQSCFGIRAKGSIDPHFLYYYTKTKVNELKGNSHGSVFDTITRATFDNIICSLPPLAEQRRIAGILSAIDDKIENNRRINTNLELQAQALFDEWLCKVNTIKGTFNDIIDATLAGDWGQETLQGNYTHEVYCIRGADIPALRNGDKGKMPIRYILERNYLVKQLRANDIVIEISGGSPTQSTGRVCMITKSLLDRLGKDVVCTNFCRAITPKNGYAIFIFLYWQMLYNKNTMFSYENGTTGIKNLNIADLISKEPINVPKQEDVDKLNVVLQPIYDQIYANGLQNETLATFRDTLLPKLMNGEIITK